jgi:hypothetical protein
MPKNLYMPCERETALLLARLAEEKGERRDTEVKNLRLSKATFQRISNRKMLSPEFLGGVEQWLLHCGWVLFEAGSVFGLVRIRTVENWPRCSSQRIEETLQEVKAKKFDFGKLEHLLEITKVDGRGGKGDADSDDDE